MNKFWKIFLITVASLVVITDLLFVFGLPRFIDLNQYKADIQKIAEEQANVTLDFDNAKVITTPLFGVGAKIDNITVKLPDDSMLFSADSIKARVALPSIFLLTVKVSCLDIEKPFINVEIDKDNVDFKVVKLIEDILNAQKEENIGQTKPVPEETFFNPAWIRIKVPNVKLNNYKILITDLATNHYLDLHGEQLVAGYFNGKTAKLKTYAELYSDENKNITANVDINTFLPPPAETLDEEDDPAERIDIPFVNPVTMYRNYDLKANLDTKLYIRSYGKDDISSFGYFKLDDVTMKVSHLQLPSTYIHAKTFKNTVNLDTNINVTNEQNIKLLGRVNYSKKPYIDLNINTSKIHFNDLIILSKAFLDSLHVNNELGQYTAAGYFEANAYIKTNFKKLKSNGKIIIANGALKIRNLGEVISKTNINLLLDENTLDIKDSSLFLGKAKVDIKGEIDEKSIADIDIHTQDIALPPLFNAFAPKELRSSYDFNSGNLKFNFTLKDKLKKAVANANFTLTDLNFADKNNSFRITDNNLNGNLLMDKKITAQVNNKDFQLLLPQTKSTITLPALNVNVADNNITIAENKILINKDTEIDYRGTVTNYPKLKNIAISADGSIFTEDIVQLIGNEFKPFIDYKGYMPIQFNVTGNKSKQTIYTQLLTNGSNYLTPINFKELGGKNIALQAIVDLKPNRLKIKKTGIFDRTITIDKKGNQVETLKNILEIDGTIAGNTINLVKVIIAEPLTGKIVAFPKSNFVIDKNKMFLYAQTTEPRIRGNFSIRNLSIPELLTSFDNFLVKFEGQKLQFLLNNLLLNGSDIQTKGTLSLIPDTNINVSDVSVKSNLINLDKIMKVSDLAMKYVPKSTSTTQTQATAPADIPVVLTNSRIDLREIKTGNIKVYNTTSDISLLENVFYINNLRTNVFSGRVNGDISMNLLTSLLNLDLKGKNINTEQALYDAAGMKDMVSGKTDFNMALSLKGTAYEEQMKSLKGNFNFIIKDGSYGPFGKIENMILAENIRESEFFQTALGGVIESLATIDTTHFSELQGKISFADGICNIDELTSSGRILALHIFGSFDLLQNIADMKVRAKMTSIISDLLGPIAMVNPVKLVNSAASMNVFTAKAFSLFCETVSQEEMDTLPPFSNKYVDNSAMKFQIVLRGDVAKPLSLVKSFKWLATPLEFEQAEEFVAQIPDPVEGSTATTIDEVIKENQALEAEKKTFKYKLLHLFDNDKKASKKQIEVKEDTKEEVKN